MTRVAPVAALFVCLLVTARGAEGDRTLVLDVWPGGKIPDEDASKIGAEKFFELKVGGKPYEVGGKRTKWLTNVTRPTLTVYRPAKDKSAGVAILICPGGGYHNLGWDVEGEEVAAWLNSLGVTGIILEYRCPRRPDDVKGDPPLGPLEDAQRAVSLVRSKARQRQEDDAEPVSTGVTLLTGDSRQPQTLLQAGVAGAFLFPPASSGAASSATSSGTFATSCHAAASSARLSMRKW